MASRGVLQCYILVLLLCISFVYGAVLSPRATSTPVCVGLSVKSNDGNRKVAIVIDSSSSMEDNDPQDLRLAAGRALNSWLISKAEATGSQKADQVTVIDFAYAPSLDYPLGDPSSANASFSLIGSSGGTYIAGGVQMAISQLNASSTGTTSGRSSIIVFTDGQDSSTSLLVKAISQASSQGIRVSFGFLDPFASIQDSTILSAITASGGVYATITSEDASNNFINFAILNGLTYNDNPAGNNNTLLAGLSISQFISGSETVSTFYNAQANEKINFTLESITAGTLSAEALFGGNVVARNSTVQRIVTFDGDTQLSVQAPSAGQFEIRVTAQKAGAKAVYVLGATSSDPIQNCSVAVVDGPGGGSGSGSGMGIGAKVGLGIGVPALVAGLLVGGFFLFKYFGHKLPPFTNPFAKSPPPVQHEPPIYDGPEKDGMVETVVDLGSGACGGGGGGSLPFIPPPVPPTKAQDPRKHHRPKHRKFENGPFHHHHLAYGHPCTGSLNPNQCQLFGMDHVCKDPEVEPKGKCVCVDQKCPLNGEGHECVDDGQGEVVGCGCVDGECEATREVERRKREKLVLGGVKMAVGQGAKAFMAAT